MFRCSLQTLKSTNKVIVFTAFPPSLHHPACIRFFRLRVSACPYPVADLHVLLISICRFADSFASSTSSVKATLLSHIVVSSAECFSTARPVCPYNSPQYLHAPTPSTPTPPSPVHLPSRRRVLSQHDAYTEFIATPRADEFVPLDEAQALAIEVPDRNLRTRVIT
eukprot:3271055-Pleurochrysis_carterae.AAC.2